MNDLIILGADEIATPVGKTARHGSEMREIRVIRDGAVVVRGGKIAAVGTTREIREKFDLSRFHVVNAAGKSVVPGFVDSHTHFLFGGYREDEFLMRLAGRGYLEIMEQGGGIVGTVRSTRGLSEDEMVALGKRRLDDMVQNGVTTAEGKSGYGLDLETELRMLRAYRRLDAEHPVDVVGTFLGAHAVPDEYAGRSGDYIRFMIDEVLPAVRQQKLAQFCDVFCEKGVFSVAESEQLLTAALGMGFEGKIHADEMEPLGGAELACRVGCVSADHLLSASADGIARLAKADTVATLLPATAFCLNKPYADARGMIDAGCAVALASDFNPGSCFASSIPLLLALGCIQMHMTVEEALTALTLNGAAAVSRASETGSIEVGKRADFLILRYPSYKFLVYNTASNIVERVFKNGKLLYDARTAAPAA